MVVGVLGDGAGPVVADGGGEGRYQHQALIQQGFDAAFIGPETLDAMLAEAGAAASEQLDAFEHVVGDHWFEHIQLEVALAGGQLHGRVVAHHLHGHHGQALGLGGIHLARHD